MALSRSRACLGPLLVLFCLFNPVSSVCDDEDECLCSPLGSGGMDVSCNAGGVAEPKTITSIVDELEMEGKADSVTQLYVSHR